MNKIMIVWFVVMGLCVAVILNPREFWIDAEPDYVVGTIAGIFVLAVFVFWLYFIRSDREDQVKLALTAFINNELTEAQRAELAEPDPRYEPNSGYLRWKENAKQSPLAYLIPATPPRYAEL
jgi:hypothetical protein